MQVAAAIAALGFAIHPLRVESVALASARGELVAAGFFLLSLLGYLKANAPEHGPNTRARWLTLALIAFSFSLLSSPSALVLPVVILFLESYRSEWMAGGAARLWAAAGRFLSQNAPYFLLSSACITLSVFARSYSPAVQPAYKEDYLSWALHQLAAPAFYLWKTLLPVGLSPAYELSGWQLAHYIAAGAIICAAVFTLRKRWPALALAWLCYLVLLWPFFRGEFPAEQLLADRYTYLASLPLALLVGLAASQFLHACRGRWSDTPTRFLGSGVVTVALVVFGFLTREQIPVWRDAETLWKNAAAVNPTSRAYFNLATLAEARSEYDDAIAFNRRVVEINPLRWDAHERAAVLLQAQGKIAEAVEHYQAVVRLNPNATEARENLAAGLVNRGEIADAIQQFQKILQLAPERNEARFKLGTILAVQGRLAEAAETLTTAANADPKDGRILLRLGQVLAAQGKLGEAMPYFREAVRLRSEDAEAHENLGRGLLQLGHKAEGAKHLQEAVRLMRLRPTAR
jgi:tetratricopeptide (TPR) repeat protein